jgi:uncharacterized membrane protein
MEQLVTIGIVVVFAGIALIIIGSLLGAGKGEAKVAVGGFIGPIPWGFANDKPLLYAVIAIAMVVFVISIIMATQKLI